MGEILLTISFPDPRLQNRVWVTWAYGQTLFSIINAGWGVLSNGFIGDHSSDNNYNLTAISYYLQQYDNAWTGI